MAEVVFGAVSKVFKDGTRAVDELSLDIADREFMVLVGPSGCGKTTALRMVGGLEQITEGKIRIGERVVNSLSPKSRDIAMVFQSYALYPHLSAYDNIAFALRIQKMPHDQVEAMTMGHRVAVMRKGELQQVASPEELYHRPLNMFVAGFIGSPAMNMLEARIERRDGQ